MFVTLVTDASVCNDNKVGGFGFWFASDRGKLCGGKPFNGSVNCSFDGEIKAVGNALTMVFRSGLIERGDTLLIQLDNLQVVNLLMGGAKTKRKDVNDALGYVRTLCKENGVHLKSRHVKGHSDVVDNRSAANRYCDKVAGEQMRLARELKGKK